MSVPYQFHNGVGGLLVLGKKVIQLSYEPKNDSSVLDPIGQLTGQHDCVATMPSLPSRYFASLIRILVRWGIIGIVAELLRASWRLARTCVRQC